MEPILEQLSALQKKESTFSETSNKANLGDVFVERRYDNYNEFYLFAAHFNTIPNLISETNIDCRKANKWFLSKYSPVISDCHFTKRYLLRTKVTELDDIFYILYEDLLVDFHTSGDKVRFLFRHTAVSKIEEIIAGIKKFQKRAEVYFDPSISLLINSGNGLTKKSLTIAKPKLSIDDNYNSDFKSIHQIIHKRLSKKNDKGLVLLHGKPGTGKTSYIRYLIASLKKEVIFLPPNMATSITNPELLTFLIDNPNSIFVIEDAENIIVDREQNGYSPVSTLLNISDGLLSDCLNIQIICTFNTDISKVDAALLRKGRMIAQYEFKELETVKAQALSKKLGFDRIITNPMTLTEIYNQEEQDFSQQKKKKMIGFNSGRG